MADRAAYPKNIFLLCKEFGLELQDLRLVCVFCANVLTDAEVVSYAYKELDVVWRKQYPFGACARCLLAAGILRQFRRWNYSAYSTTVEQETGQSVDTLFVRCYLCHKPLCHVEKAKHVEEQRRYHKIAGNWTGTCLQCWRRCMEPNLH
ncbi:E6 [Macaca mulatta papillomavirus 3]|uniref:Protein E6 n=1 Tax=Macaca mulatta papillomavirus 3 TaxID=2294151 RepID=A0A385AH96_9PAPI|nr:E6 [Macaca mulatta papillomavirus 3]AXN57287.1 E6 [Macaca mulatta papillomavirus 3]